MHVVEGPPSPPLRKPKETERETISLPITQLQAGRIAATLSLYGWRRGLKEPVCDRQAPQTAGETREKNRLVSRGDNLIGWPIRYAKGSTYVPRLESLRNRDW